MEIRLSSIGVQDAAGILTDLAAVMACSAARGDIAPENYAGVFEVIGAIAGAIKQEAGGAA